ncbi:hypothetical protein [Moorena sp. SIO4A5]|uniref:hypothetical protein n=1 Tax=Moorena sp. SIO4A5 TaxID=2607838 RepID=UPI0013C7E10E|nr:hypothetical protein [Moorena sp. SIO4A5]NEO22232.1 hypothetical protein [Moorena sp. SIO4A5]
MLTTINQLKNIEALPGVRIWQVIESTPELILFHDDLLNEPFDEDAFFQDIRAGLKAHGEVWFIDGFAISKKSENLYLTASEWDDWVRDRLIENGCIKEKEQPPKTKTIDLSRLAQQSSSVSDQKKKTTKVAGKGKKPGRPGVSKKKRR